MTRSPKAFWLLLCLAAYLAVGVVGVQAVRQSTQMRESFQRLVEARRREDDHLREYRLLLLERATFAGYQNVERVAAAELGMDFPEAVVQVSR